MKYVYIDQNILQYAHDKKNMLAPDSEICWVYSNEHFTEMDRFKNSAFLTTLEQICARRVRIILDSNFKITDNAIIEDYREPKDVYQEYQDAINKVQTKDFGFNNFLALLHGNKEALDPDIFCESFKKNIHNLLSGLKDLEMPAGFQQSFDKYIDDLSMNLRETILKIKKDILPLPEMRKKISGKRLSELKPENGPIIEQIWELVKGMFGTLSKDQLFGYEPFQYEKQEKKPFLLAVSKCYEMLNFLGYWPDEKLSSCSKMYGINSDASHVAHAGYCQMIVSADMRLCKKAQAIYEYFGTKTIVYQYILENKTIN
jgi:hypothetical protein